LIVGKFFVKFRYWLLGITILLGAVCGVMMPRVNVNNDLSKYLPDDSRMKAGVDIIMSEFAGSASQAVSADVRMMFCGLSQKDSARIEQELMDRKEVETVYVETKSTDKGDYVLYSMMVHKDVNQIEFGDELRDDYGNAMAVETSQDSGAADASMLVIAVVILLIILFAMCKSWMEPLLFIASTGIAVLLNLGTNALLESVSVTTHSIAAVLQLVLSMDYSIILANRFRQEKEQGDDLHDAMARAVKQATPSVLSSAFTTIVGLLVLVFINLKIGADLGIVLAKGVVCSLVCNFTVLPALLFMASKAIDKSGKKTLSLPIRGLSKFVYGGRIVLAVVFVALCVASFIFRENTSIKYSNKGVSEIDKIFPQKNITVVIYDRQDEQKVMQLADSLATDSMVEVFVSYPSLLQREYKCSEMMGALDGMMEMGKGFVDSLSLPALTDDMLKIVYYASQSNEGDNMKVAVMELFSYVLEQSNDTSSMIATHLDADMKEKLDLFGKFLNESTQPVEESHHRSKPKAKPVEKKVEEQEVPVDISQTDSFIGPPEYEGDVEVETIPYNRFEDYEMIHKGMYYAEMTEFLGMDENQTKMAYKMMGRKNQTVEPIEFIHYICDEVLSNKMLAMMVSKSQKEQVRAVRQMMDVADARGPVTEPEETGVVNMKKKKVVRVETVSVIMPETKKPKDDPMAKMMVLLNEMLDTTNKYNAKQLFDNVGKLGMPIDSSMIDLLYLYYGANKHFDDNWTMSVEEMINFISDSVMNDAKFAAFIDDTVKNDFSKVQAELISGLAMMRSDKYGLAVIVTDYPGESTATYDFIDRLNATCDRLFDKDYYMIGESVMYSEMKAGFDDEILFITLLTIISILIIVAISFKSLLIPLILVMIIMTAVFVNVVVSGLGGGSLLYVAYLIVQSILMGATIDYGILYANCYREHRATMEIKDAIVESYRNSINTILTSGLIMIVTPVLLSMTITDATVAEILKSISIGALASVVLILFVLPALLVIVDKLIIRKKNK